MSSPDPVVVARPFNWGVVLVSDQLTDDIPSSSEGGFSPSTQALAIAVRHAQDVDDDLDLQPDDAVPPFVVRVCAQEGRADRCPDFACEIAVPSGTLAIGDAEEEALVELQPGTYRIEVAVDNVEHPESVHIWWSSAD